MRALQLDANPAAEPLGTWTGRPRTRDGVREWALEYSSRGDRVAARVLVPASGDGPFPLVIAQHGLGHHKANETMDTIVLPWARAGAAVASIDFPLHGERASAKLSERVMARDPRDGGLWRDLAEQAVADLRRLLPALDADERIDSSGPVYAGFSLGAILGTIFCAEEPRIAAAALALGGAAIGPAETDPVHWAPRLAPRPVLFVQAERDETVPRAAAEALHAATREPKRVVWFDSGHTDLPGIALKEIWAFLESRGAGG